jgi:hypothetical protein
MTARQSACRGSLHAMPANLETHPMDQTNLPANLDSLRCSPTWRVLAHRVRVLCLLIACCGCSAFPDIRHKQQFHNPFPELTRVAVLPFRNQSEEQTLNGARVSLAYYNELQSIPGFEVIPLGVVENQLGYFQNQILHREMATSEDFQKFAQHLGVDAVLQGAITDYSAYYPPRMTLKVNWYAANPGLHPIPVGYGLPWGTKDEKNIPEWVRLEAERALAKEQIRTQTPEESQEVGSGLASPITPTPQPPATPPQPIVPENVPATPQRRDVDHLQAPSTDGDPIASKGQPKRGRIASARILLPRLSDESVVQAAYEEIADPLDSGSDPTLMDEPERLPAKIAALETQPALIMNERGEFVLGEPAPPMSDEELESTTLSCEQEGVELPPDWPDPNGFIPRKPSPERPRMRAQYEPVISHMKAYNGNDEDFTQSLEDYYYFRDDARVGGWQTYLQRSEDFIRFCCHLHVVETLGSRGGQLKSRLNVRWPIYRYVR